MEKKISSERIYEGKIINLRKDKVLLPNNEVTFREVIEHNGGVAIALENDDGKFFLVNQFRYGPQKNMLEFPAGKKEKGEDSLSTAKREIIEETGYSGKDYMYLGSIVPTGAYLEEIIDMYYAKVDMFYGQNLDSDEFIIVEQYTLDDIINKIMKNEIIDAKTIAMAFKIKEIKSLTNINVTNYIK